MINKETKVWMTKPKKCQHLKKLFTNHGSCSMPRSTVNDESGWPNKEIFFYSIKKMFSVIIARKIVNLSQKPESMLHFRSTLFPLLRSFRMTQNIQTGTQMGRMYQIWCVKIRKRKELAFSRNDNKINYHFAAFTLAQLCVG